MKDDWDKLFDEMYLRGYAVLGRGGDAEAQALGAVRLAGVEPPAEVLDAPCGYGRHSIPLALAGYRVTGADRSPVLLAEARRRAGAADSPRLRQADHRQLPFEPTSFDCVLNLFSSLGYRGEEGDRATLGEFHRVLRPGGSLVVETMHRDRLIAIFQPRGWDNLGGGSTLLEERRFDPVSGMIETDHVIVGPDGQRQGITYRIRLYTATELVRLLEEAGYVGVECFGGLEREPLTAQTRLVILARTPE